MIARIPLERIFDNPFQTRQIYNDIEELAQSILALKTVRPETSGLLQVPTARIVIAQGNKGWKVLDHNPYGQVSDCLGDEPDAVIHLAFGHRRLRAFHLLSQTDDDYKTFPVEVLQLNDERMSDLAWEENAKRSDLSPIERAEALQRAIETFGYTQEAIGERWGMAKSTVSNALRLLKLPAEAQEPIRKGELTERHGKILLMAQAKSPAIFQKAMAEILPPPPIPEDTLEKATRLVSDRHLWETYNVPETATCAACGASLSGHAHTGGSSTFLCDHCHKAATYITPSASEAEDIVKRTINRFSVPLERAGFPLDAEFAPIADPEQGLTWLRSATCTGCTYREGDVCLDRTCHELKGKSWEAAQATQLKERLKQDYGIDPQKVVINYSYTGHDLDKNGVDPDLIKPGGPCAPGNCSRLQFHYQTYDSSRGIKPYKDLPFIFQCNHSGAHAAAQKRYTESQKSQEEKTEAVQAAEAVATRKAEAKVILDRALTSFAIALRDGHDGAWKALYETFRYTLSSDHKHEPEAGAPGVMLLIAGQVLRDYRESLKSKWHDWGREDAVERFQEGISKKLNNYGIVQTAHLADIIAKAEKILEFVWAGRTTGKITMEQIQGNRVNLQKLVDQLAELHRAGQIREASDLNRAANLIRETLDELWEAAGDIDQPLPQDWGMEIEATLNQFVRVEVSRRNFQPQEEGDLAALKAELEAEIETVKSYPEDLVLVEGQITEPEQVSAQ